MFYSTLNYLANRLTDHHYHYSIGNVIIVYCDYDDVGGCSDGEDNDDDAAAAGDDGESGDDDGCADYDGDDDDDNSYLSIQ